MLPYLSINFFCQISCITKHTLQIDFSVWWLLNSYPVIDYLGKSQWLKESDFVEVFQKAALKITKPGSWLEDFIPSGSQCCPATPNGTMFHSHMEFACKSLINAEITTLLLCFNFCIMGSLRSPSPNDIYVASRIYLSVYPVPLPISHNNVQDNGFISALHLP